MKKAASKSSHLMSVCQSDIFAANILELQKRGLYFPYYLVVTKRHCRSAVRCPPKTICRRCVALSVGRNDGYFPDLVVVIDYAFSADLFDDIAELSDLGNQGVDILFRNLEIWIIARFYIGALQQIEQSFSPPPCRAEMP